MRFEDYNLGIVVFKSLYKQAFILLVLKSPRHEH